jgi:hypothetical protein
LLEAAVVPEPLAERLAAGRRAVEAAAAAAAAARRAKGLGRLFLEDIFADSGPENDYYGYGGFGRGLYDGYDAYDGYGSY